MGEWNEKFGGCFCVLRISSENVSRINKTENERREEREQGEKNLRRKLVSTCFELFEEI